VTERRYCWVFYLLLVQVIILIGCTLLTKLCKLLVVIAGPELLTIARDIQIPRRNLATILNPNAAGTVARLALAVCHCTRPPLALLIRKFGGRHTGLYEQVAPPS